MTGKITITSQLAKNEINQVYQLIEKNQTHYNIQHKLDLNSDQNNEKLQHLRLWENENLAGYAALSCFDSIEVEATIVAAQNDEQISQIEQAIKGFVHQINARKLLLILDRNDRFLANYLAEKNSYSHTFSEYRMVLVIESFEAEKNNNIDLEIAQVSDKKAVANLENFFGSNESPIMTDEDLKKTFILRKKSEVIASIRIEEENKRFGIYGFVVRSDFRGQGLGRKIMTHAIQNLLKNDAREIYLEVDSSNEIAHHLYCSLGFKEKVLFDYYEQKM